MVAASGTILLGAAWYRLWTPENNIRGFFDETTPVVVVGVRSDYRRQGVGTSLVGWLIDRARKQSVRRLSLMVSRDNHAMGLYAKLGFREHADVGDSVLMVRDMQPGIQ